MGFFDKVKAMANKITGGGAKVTLVVEGTSVKDVIKVHVNAVVKDAPIDISKAYLYVKSVEKVKVARKELPGGESGNPHDLNLDLEMFKKQEFVIAPAQTLEGGKTYDFTYELTLPAGVTPTFSGRYANHEWQFYAGLDAKGNDPDSGWVTAVLN
jgi:hypothetical protein